jgi:hypothetical protein
MNKRQKPIFRFLFRQLPKGIAGSISYYWRHERFTEDFSIR